MHYNGAVEATAENSENLSGEIKIENTSMLSVPLNLIPMSEESVQGEFRKLFGSSLMFRTDHLRLHLFFVRPEILQLKA